MVDGATQLKIDDNFTRAKRTLLLFSAGLLALGLATDPTAPAVDLTFLSVNIDAAIVRALLFGAVVYYGLLFTVEWRSIVRLNNAGNVEESSIDKFVGELQAKFYAVSEHLTAFESRRHAERVAQLGEEVAQWATGMPSKELVADALETNLQGRMPSGETIDRKLIDRAVADAMTNAHIPRGGEPALERAAAELGAHNGSINNLVEAIDRASTGLDKVHRDLTRLSDALGRERIVAFYGLEVIATYVFAAAAVAVGFPPARYLLDAALTFAGVALPGG